MTIKCNVRILNRQPGDLIYEGDRDYEDFKRWAERADRKGGCEICQFEGVPSVVPPKAPAPAIEDSTLSKASEEEITTSSTASGEMDRKAIMAKLREKGVKFFAGAKIEDLLAKLKEAGE